MSYEIYKTQLRDGAAMRILPHMLGLHINLALEDGSDAVSQRKIASDAWELAEAFIAERERRYGPAEPEPVEQEPELEPVEKADE